jgi:HEAT repeat protein
MPDTVFNTASGCRTWAAAVCLAALAGTIFPGCAGWTPWKDPQKAQRNAELYGPTANQRIKTLQEQAQAAKKQGREEQIEFTREISRKILEEHDPRVRCELVAVAAEFDTASAEAVCKGAMQDPDERVRIKACDVWQKRGGEEAVQLLASRYRTDRELDVRLRALRMLGELKDKNAIPVLAEALEDPDPAVQYRAVASLKEVSGRDLGDDVNKWREWAADPDAKQPWSIAETFRQLF